MKYKPPTVSYELLPQQMYEEILDEYASTLINSVFDEHKLSFLLNKLAEWSGHNYDLITNARA